MENIVLLTEEKEFLYSKIEYIKKKNLQNKNLDIYNFLKNEEDEVVSEDLFIKILNCLEYTFKKKLKGLDKPIKKEVFESLLNKVPKIWKE